jgi:hypothetical protein
MCHDPRTRVHFDDRTNLLQFAAAGTVADIPNGHYYNGQIVQGWGVGPNNNQRWWRRSARYNTSGGSVDKSGWQQIRTVNGGGNYCLDVPYGLIHVGAPLQIWLCAAGEVKNQAFWFADQ